MSFKLDTNDYIAYMMETKEVIGGQKDYITELDATTGDGDHWANLYMGFEKITGMSEDLKTLNISDLLKKIGMTMFSAIGGSSGALYGSGYVAAAKAIQNENELTVNSLYTMLDAMLKAIMERGKTHPGQKTMVDSLYNALVCYRKGLEANKDEKDIIEMFINGAKEGAENTKNMEAARGRASYRTDKGVGHLDPGAVTMALQLECLGNYILHKLGGTK